MRWRKKLQYGARLMAVILCLAASPGCVPYWVIETVQPKINFNVWTADEKPVAKARVHLITGDSFGPKEASREIRLTDTSGTAQFPGRYEWETKVVPILVMYLPRIRTWDWCVEKGGFETVRTSFFDDRAKGISDVNVTLKKGKWTPCPIPHEPTEEAIKQKMEETRLKQVHKYNKMFEKEYNELRRKKE